MCQGLELLELNRSRIILCVLFNDSVKLREACDLLFSVVHSPRKGDYSGHELWLISEVHSVRKRQQTQFTVRGIPGNLKEKITQ